MTRDLLELLLTPEPYADAGWCGNCAACAAARRRHTQICGCPVGHRRAAAHGEGSPFTVSATVRRSGAGPTTPSCLHALGRRLAHGLYHGAALHQLPRLKGTHVLLEAVAVVNRSRRSPGSGACSESIDHSGLTHHQALALASSHLQQMVATQDLSERTVTKVISDIASLAEFMTSGLGRPFVAQTTRADVARWVEARLGGRRLKGQEAAATTRRLRRGHARLYFRVLRNLGMYDSDPTLDIAVHPGVSGTTIALADTELLQLRYACISLEEDVRLPSCLALAEVTATSGEIAKVLIDDVDLVQELVWLRGDSRRLARLVPLSPWGVKVLRSRIEYLRAAGATGSTPVVYGGNHDATTSESPGASTAGALGELLRMAGLAGEPGIRPGSIGLGFALRVWERHGDIRLVARALGYRDYNKAADAIGIDPQAALDQADVTDALRACVLPDDVIRYRVGKSRSGSGRRGRRPAPSTTTPVTAQRTVRRTGGSHGN